jgi:hypothetical protein
VGRLVTGEVVGGQVVVPNRAVKKSIAASKDTPILSETRTLNMARNLPDFSGFDCGGRRP